MPANINVTKEIQQAFNMTRRVINDMGLYASSALTKVRPEGVTAQKVLEETTMNNEGILVIKLGYTLDNIPAHGTYQFTFIFKTPLAGAVMITKTTDSGILTKSCSFNKEEIDNAVNEIAFA